MIQRAYIGFFLVLLCTTSSELFAQKYRLITVSGSSTIYGVESVEQEQQLQQSDRPQQQRYQWQQLQQKQSQQFQTQDRVESAIYRYLTEISRQFPELGIINPHEQFKIVDRTIGVTGAHHVELQQIVQATHFYGGTIILHLRSDMSFKSISGRLLKSLEVSNQIRINERLAKSIAYSQYWNEDFFEAKRAQARRLSRAFCKRRVQTRSRRMFFWCYRWVYRIVAAALRRSFHGETQLLTLSKNFISGRDDTSDTKYVWKVDVSDRQALASITYFIDAQTGQLVHRDDNLRGDRVLSRKVYDCSISGDCKLDQDLEFNFSGSSFTYTLGRSEGMPPRGTHPFLNSDDVDEFYAGVGSLDQFINSHVMVPYLDFVGNQLVQVNELKFSDVALYTHYDATTEGQNLCDERPSFNGETPLGQKFVAFCRSAEADYHDNLAHEYAHFITSQENLLDSGETGAIAEAFSDFIGEAYERHVTGSNDWRLYSAGTHSFERNMSDPTRSFDNTSSAAAGISSPDKYTSTDYYCGSLDNGGVHINAGVLNKALHLMVEGGVFNQCQIQGIGFEKVQRVLYHAVETHFTASTTFNNAYTDISNACNSLQSANFYGLSIQDCQQIVKAMQAVMMDQVGGCNVLNENPASCAEVLTSNVPGDYDFDGDVDLADYLVFQRNYGMTGNNVPGDGNGNGEVDGGDYTIWRDCFDVAGDYDRDCDVDNADLMVWQRNFGQTGAPGIPGDGNKDGIVDGADYTVWRDNFREETNPGDYNGDGAVNNADLLVWQREFGSTGAPGIPGDGNRDGVVDGADYTVWRDNVTE